MFAEILKGAKLLQGVAAEIYLDELASCPIREMTAGEILIAPGIKHRCILLILSGSLSIHLERPETEPVGHVGAGDIVGEISLISHSVTSAWVVGETPGRLLMIDEHRLWGLIDQAPLIARNLLMILTGWITTVNGHVLEQRKQIDILQDAARLDGLTGLCNRRWFDESLARLLARRVHHPVTLILMDIDHFKRFNDTHGHPGGDQALRALAELLKATLRLHDIAARYGGEEFALILPETGLSAATVVAERLRQAAAVMPIHALDGAPLSTLTLSLGIATGSDDATPESLIRLADERLYQAKHEGRNRVCVG
ncbi:MAG: GGDEF domain-containing protein [Magnetococcales bacterium]|nr:GGDEF domain-containing protein [Magnetococcales bacterium]